MVAMEAGRGLPGGRGRPSRSQGRGGGHVRKHQQSFGLQNRKHEGKMLEGGWRTARAGDGGTGRGGAVAGTIERPKSRPSETILGVTGSHGRLLSEGRMSKQTEGGRPAGETTAPPGHAALCG